MHVSSSWNPPWSGPPSRREPPPLSLGSKEFCCVDEQRFLYSYACFCFDCQIQKNRSREPHFFADFECFLKKKKPLCDFVNQKKRYGHKGFRSYVLMPGSTCQSGSAPCGSKKVGGFCPNESGRNAMATSVLNKLAPSVSTGQLANGGGVIARSQRFSFSLCST